MDFTPYKPLGSYNYLCKQALLFKQGSTLAIPRYADSINALDLDGIVPVDVFEGLQQMFEQLGDGVSPHGEHSISEIYARAVSLLGKEEQ